MDVSGKIKTLPCTDGLILLKLVSRTKLLSALKYLKANKLLYHDITTDVSEKPSDMISFLDELIHFSVNTCSEELQFQDF